MKTSQLILILLIIVIVSIGATMMAYSFYKVVGKNAIPYDFKIDDITGFVLNNDALHFGRFGYESTSTRIMNIANDNKFPVRVEIKAHGDFEEFVLPMENFFVMEPNSKKELKMTATVPKDTPPGNYSGYVTFIYKRV